MLKQELVDINVNWSMSQSMTTVSFRIRLTDDETGKKFMMVGSQLKGDVTIIDDNK